METRFLAYDFRMHMQTHPDEVVWQTPASHWCGDCWHWVVDCVHLVPPLRLPHTRVTGDQFVQSMAYDRDRQRLEVRYFWKEAVQFYPVPPALFAELGQAKSILGRLAEEKPRVQWDHVRTERVIVSTLLKGFGIAFAREFSVTPT